MKIPRARSQGEATLELHLRVYGLAPIREFKFCGDREWRADLAFPEHKLLIEVEGGTWSGGRHQRGAGFTNDCLKYNAAALLGFTVLRYTTEMVMNGAAGHQIAEYITKRRVAA